VPVGDSEQDQSRRPINQRCNLSQPSALCHHQTTHKPMSTKTRPYWNTDYIGKEARWDPLTGRVTRHKVYKGDPGAERLQKKIALNKQRKDNPPPQERRADRDDLFKAILSTLGFLAFLVFLHTPMGFFIGFTIALALYYFSTH
jgi:hypothetical protein